MLPDKYQSNEPPPTDRDVRHLVKMARHGMVNRLHDSARLLEIAQRLENVTNDNRDLRDALIKVTDFMTRHSDQIHSLLDSDPHVGELIAAVAKASQPRTPRPVKYTEVEIPLGSRIQDAEAVNAAIGNSMPCAECNGSGWVSDTEHGPATHRCPVCEGKGNR